MASVRRVSRFGLWWCCLLCVLSVTSVNAATRKYVNKPSAQTAASGVPSRSGSSLEIDYAISGEYIPASGPGTPGVPIKVLDRNYFSIPTTITSASGILKGSLAGVVVGAALDAMIDSVGAFIDENQKLAKNGCLINGVPSDPINCTNPPSNNGVHQYGVCNYYNASETIGKQKVFQHSTGKYAHTASYTNPGSGWVMLNNCTSTSRGYTPNAQGEWPRSYRKLLQPIDIAIAPVPLEASDYSAMESFANGQNAEWLRGLMQEACTNSPNPAGCYEQLRSQSVLAGPSTISGPSTTSSTLTTSASGTTGTVTTTTTTNYNVTYGPNYYDYSKTTTTTTANPDGSTSTTTATEDPVVTEEQPADEPEQATASPCAANCDGPAYADLYTPTEDTKEAAIDGYLSRIGSIPIIAATTSFFDVSVSAGCPTWNVSTSMEVAGTTMPIDLEFNHHCLPWFAGLSGFASAVMALVCSLIAYRIAILD